MEKGHCWIEGDNASNSIDSYRFGQVVGVWRSDGQVPLGLLEGRVTRVVFPFSSVRKIGAFESQETRVLFKEEDIKE